MHFSHFEIFKTNPVMMNVARNCVVASKKAVRLTDEETRSDVVVSVPIVSIPTMLRGSAVWRPVFVSTM